MTNREIKDLMRFFDNSGITKVKIKDGEFSIELGENSV
jgi:acetyl-CoA carboxylase biotin carboxyl carrier protein